MKHYTAATALPVDRESAFAYHERPGALERLIPPWKDVAIESTDQSLKPGSQVTLRPRVGPLRLRWVAQHQDYDRPRLFSDFQASGPFAHWFHEHRFTSDSPNHCLLEDSIAYRLPGGPIGQFFGGAMARRELETMFAYRHRVTRDDLDLSDQNPVKPMTVAISGSSGLVGGRLSSLLTLLGHKVLRLERSLEKANLKPDAVAPWSDESEAAKLSGVDAVVHLAGKSIAESRWTDDVKKQIRESRVNLTRSLAESLADLETPPKVFVCASAIGIYGNRGDDPLREDSDLGGDFLADIAKEWEAACEPARRAGIRVANARLGLVLDPSAGALKKMLLPARFFGGKVGRGTQWWSWIALDDVIGALYHAICRDEIQGPFNVTAPHPTTAGEFAKTLASVIGRLAIFPAPAFGLRVAMGEMADALLLSSTRVLPEVLEKTGYRFRFTDLRAQLRYCLGKDRLESL